MSTCYNDHMVNNNNLPVSSVSVLCSDTEANTELIPPKSTKIYIKEVGIWEYYYSLLKKTFKERKKILGESVVNAYFQTAINKNK